MMIFVGTKLQKVVISSKFSNNRNNIKTIINNIYPAGLMLISLIIKYIQITMIIKHL